jgi:hypothetical protein
MAKPKGTHFVISANLLASGAPCWRRKDGSWATDLQEAHPAATADERDAMLAAAAKEEAVVADPYFFDVCLDGQAIDPLTAREEIRAKGPSVAYRRPDRAA